jgi:4-alpha-glucanotransferase
MSPLHALAEAAGLARVWEDAKSTEQIVSDEALTAILAALGYPARTEAEARASLAALQEEAAQPPAFLSTDVGVPLALPSSLAADTAELHLEHGATRTLPIEDGELPGIAEPGYHRLHIGAHELVLAVAPQHCLAPPPGKRWGAAIQIPSLHERATPYGDFADLRSAVRLLAERGADAVAISPVHAPPAARTDGFSPYSPSSRLFLNAAFASPSFVIPAKAGIHLQVPPVTRGQEMDPRFRGGDEVGGGGTDLELIDWPAALTEHARALRRAFADLTADQRAEVSAWAQAQGPALERHALYDALAPHLHESDWRQWPLEYRNPAARGPAQFAAEHADAVALHLYAQYRAHQTLAAVQDEAVEAGMAIGLIADLAVGIDPGGSDAWALQEAMLAGLTIGAPPDPLGPDGQNWALTGFSPQGLQRTAFAPWIATLRAALRHAGGVRIDHAFGLARLWVVPEGRGAGEGAYLAYPFADMLRILALESHRAGALVIGEDLGTRPPGFVEPFATRGLLGMRVLWFEREEGAFRPAADFPEAAVAMTGTHDTATVAGWWTGRDIAWNRRLARGDWQDEEQTRMTDRQALWSTIGAGAPQPAETDPAPVVEAAIAHLGATPSALAIVPLEDLLGLEEQPNLPGTIDEHPNWRRRLSGPLADLLAEPVTARRIAALVEARAA